MSQILTDALRGVLMADNGGHITLDSYTKAIVTNALEKSAPKITIGKLYVKVLNSETIWIQSEKEGAAFSADTVEKVLTDFFYSNF